MRIFFNDGRRTKAYEFVRLRFIKKYKDYLEQIDEFTFPDKPIKLPPKILEMLKKGDYNCVLDFLLIQLELSTTAKELNKTLENLWSLYLINLNRAKSYKELWRI